MKTFRVLLQALLLLTAVGPSQPETLAQRGERLPPGLSQNASHAEVVAWLDEGGFAAARVGLNIKGTENVERWDGTTEYGTLGERFIFSRGFRLARLEGCDLTLRNERVELLFYDDDAWFTIGGDGRHRFYDVGKTETRYVAELTVPLQRMSVTKGRGAYRHTGDAKTAARLGAWRTTFKTTKGPHVSVFVYPDGRREESEFAAGETLTFTFDTRAEGERFHAAFRRAIQLCAGR